MPIESGFVPEQANEPAKPVAEKHPDFHFADTGKEARIKQHLPVVPVFDGYRALAILGVVILHILAGSGLLVGHSFANTVVQASLGQAVEVLFVVSGFVVFLPTVARRGEFGSVWSYFIRRAARLIPAYWAILVICLLVLWLFPLDGAGLPDIGTIGAHVIGAQVLVSGLVQNFDMGMGIDGPVWTLSLEIGFYLILPLIAGIYFRRPWIGLVAAAAITMIWKLVMGDVYWVPDHLGIQLSAETALRWATTGVSQLPNWAFSFASGMTGAWVFVRVSEDLDRWAGLIRIVQPVSLTCLVASGLWLGDHANDFTGIISTYLARNASVPSLIFTLSLATFMVSTTVAPGWTQRPFDNRLIRKLGDISYGIYLVHVPLISTRSRSSSSGDPISRKSRPSSSC